MGAAGSPPVGQPAGARTWKPAVSGDELRPSAVAVARSVYLPGSSALPFSLPENLTLLAPALAFTGGSEPTVTVFGFLPFTVFLVSTSSFTVAAVESVKEIVVPRATPFGGLPATTNFE